jgi:hypothetical protein
MASQDTRELYLTSKKNGNHQSWPEFNGNITTTSATNMRGIGSILVIDPSMDLDIADVLSSGSSGQYSFQLSVEFNNVAYFNALNVAEPMPYELVIMYSYSSVLTTNKGKSDMDSTFLTKKEVLDTKGKDSAMDYTELTEGMDGGRRRPMPLNGVGQFLERSGKLIKAAQKAESAVTGAGYNLSGGAAAAAVSNIDKYLAD